MKPTTETEASRPGSGAAPCSASDETIRLAKEATRHLLNAICGDPRKYWLMGNGTGSWEKLTTAHAALFGLDVNEIRKNFQPDKAPYERYLAELEANEKLLNFRREILECLSQCEWALHDAIDKNKTGWIQEQARDEARAMLKACAKTPNSD